MELTPSLKNKIQNSELLEEETKYQLIQNWGRLDDSTKEKIINLLEEINEDEFFRLK